MRAVAIRLTGAMASWGDIAMGEVRPTLPWPTRSALVGLTAACAGVPRTDATGLSSMIELQFAVQVDREGTPLRDYQTVQTPTGKGSDRTQHRRHELQFAGHTMLTYRDYVCDGAWTVLAWRHSEGAPSLESLVDAYARPGFVPFLGRKCCALSAPMAPKIVEGATLAACFQAAEAGPAAQPQDRGTKALVAWTEGTVAAGIEVLRSADRRDDPVLAGRYHYEARISHNPRREAVGWRSRMAELDPEDVR